MGCQWERAAAGSAGGGLSVCSAPTAWYGWVGLVAQVGGGLIVAVVGLLLLGALALDAFARWRG